MLKVGITGGIGSGKSVVSKIIESQGFHVFSADRASKNIIDNDIEVKHGLIELFGDTMFMSGELNKALLAKIIFSDDTARKNVNALIHPKVRNAFEEFVLASNKEIVFNEAAILFETGGHEHLDKVILVTAPESLRIERVMKRDGVPEELVRARMEKQWSDNQKIPFADHVIINDEKEPLLIQIESVLAELTN
jgi:dephospho-CoA kinase